MSKRRKKEDRKKVSEKISLLRHEGKDEKEAVGEAYGMLRSGRLKRHGVYRHKRSGRRSSR